MVGFFEWVIPHNGVSHSSKWQRLEGILEVDTKLLKPLYHLVYELKTQEL